MPPSNLPEKAKKVYLEAESSAKKTCPEGERHEECVARKAWAAVKRGWKKEGDTWIPKSVQEFSLYINKATYNKETQQMKWYAVASDIEPDLYNDEMSLELYADFINKIESKETPPERHRSDYWSGGLPYLSVSHYLDLNGKGVPGTTENVYVDGKCLKANGEFNNTVLGKACFDAICRDLYSEEKSDNENKIRISIAFIDWGHTHKSNGYEFKRGNLDDLCPECLKELIVGNGEGKIFKSGHLIHLALTRVPVNERTSMEVERSMTTQVEDAKSIIGDEVFEEVFTEKELEEMKADLVIKADQEDKVEEVPEVEEEKGQYPHKKDKKEDDEEEEDMEEKDEKKKAVHVLEPAIESFLSAYNEIASQELPYQNKLQAVQGAFEQFGEAIKASFYPTKEEQEQHTLTEIKSMLEQLLSRQDMTEQKISILEQKSMSPEPKQQIQQPIRRSLQLDPIGLSQPAQNKPKSLHEIVRKTVGLNN